MIKSFEFYFDFVSPYSFIAHKEVIKIERSYQVKINYMPIILGELHKLAGIIAPGLIPIKAKHMIKDCKLLADKYKIKFRFNPYFPVSTLNLMRGVLVAENKEFSRMFINKIFDAVWQDGLNINDDLIISRLIKNLDINPKNFFTLAGDQKIEDELKKRTNDAYSKGVFGAPTFIVNNKIFWGQDRLEFAINEAKK